MHAALLAQKWLLARTQLPPWLLGYPEPLLVPKSSCHAPFLAAFPYQSPHQSCCPLWNLPPQVKTLGLQSSRVDMRVQLAGGFVEENRLLLFPIDEVSGAAASTAHLGKAWCKHAGGVWSGPVSGTKRVWLSSGGEGEGSSPLRIAAYKMRLLSSARLEVGGPSAAGRRELLSLLDNGCGLSSLKLRPSMSDLHAPAPAAAGPAAASQHELAGPLFSKLPLLLLLLTLPAPPCLAPTAAGAAAAAQPDLPGQGEGGHQKGGGRGRGGQGGGGGEGGGAHAADSAGGWLGVVIGVAVWV